MEYQEDLSYPDLLILAAKREEKALALYQDLYNKGEDEDLKEVLKGYARKRPNIWQSLKPFTTISWLAKAISLKTGPHI